MKKAAFQILEAAVQKGIVSRMSASLRWHDPDQVVRVVSERRLSAVWLPQLFVVGMVCLATERVK